MHSNWTPFEHQIYRSLEEISLSGKRLLLMVSGGADSMALLAVVHRLQFALGCELAVLHCHHGPADNLPQKNFRDEAADFVATEAKKRNTAFFLAHSEQALSSEEEMRDFRKACAQKMVRSQSFDGVFWAHQQDDLLETQLLRLIRGAGPQAALQPMSLRRGLDVRPFLNSSRQDIKTYLRDQKIEWLEDPSNEEPRYLRNWLRHVWLPQLEDKCPGALKSLARSLDLIRESWNETLPEGIWLEEGISRPIFLTLSEAQKKQVLALYLRRVGQKEFTHNQIKEILKHLDISRTNHTFKAVHLDWRLSKDLISASSAFVVNAF